MKNFLILLFVNIKLIFSFNLEKYGKMKVNYNTIVHDSSDFNLDDKIEFKFTYDSTNCYCENILHYQFYDLFKRVYRYFHANYSITSSKEDFKDKKDIKYFTIYKSNKVLNGLDGNFLLLKYNCTGMVEIESISHKLKEGHIALIIISIIIAIIAIANIIYFLKRNKNARNSNKANNINRNINNNINNSNNNKNNNPSRNNNEIKAAISNTNNLESSNNGIIKLSK